MKVDHVLILAAGKGTRMGNVGKALPKVLWPLFEKSLLELQVEFAKELAPEADIYINLYHENSFIKENFFHKDAKIITEELSLDIGGGVHNLAKKLNYNGNLLILNGDQFLCFDESFLDSAIAELASFDSVLFGFQVNSSQGYNELSVENKKLVVLNQNNILERNITHTTYTGVAIINLNRLENKIGESKFFETVANFKEKNICVLDTTHFEYWDFGTVERYISSIKELLIRSDSKLYHFLVRNQGILKKKHDGQNYNTTNGLNFTDTQINDCLGSIIFKLANDNMMRSKCIIYNDKNENISQFLD